MIPSEKFLTYPEPVIIFNLYYRYSKEINETSLERDFLTLNYFRNYIFIVNKIPANFDDITIAARNDSSYNKRFVKLKGPKANDSASTALKESDYVLVVDSQDIENLEISVM